jgi:hypothetical protein
MVDIFGIVSFSRVKKVNIRAYISFQLHNKINGLRVIFYNIKNTCDLGSYLSYFVYYYINM